MPTPAELQALKEHMMKEIQEKEYYAQKDIQNKLQTADRRYAQDQDSIMRAFEIAFEHAIREVVTRKLAERMKDIEKYMDAVNLETVISDILASEFVRQLVAGRLLGSGTSSGAAGGPLLNHKAAVAAQAQNVLKGTP